MKRLIAIFGLALSGCISVQKDVAVVATLETASTPGGGDAADDPCVWVHPERPADSLIIGTDKDGGLMVFDLTGGLLQYFDGVQPNNVDLRYNFPFGGRTVDIVVAGDRQSNTVAVWMVDAEARRVRPLSIGRIRTGLSEVYGSCLYRSARDGAFYVFVNSKDGVVEQWRLRAEGDTVQADRVRFFDVGEQTEGCVADDSLGVFYVGEETHGIWRYGAEPADGDARIQVDQPTPAGHFTPDVEGLTLYTGPGDAGYLIASSQGSNDYCVYERAAGNRYLGRFRITDGAIDGTSETDGIDVTTAALGPRFPRGAFVAQDDVDDQGNQNFKLVPWPAIAASFRPRLEVFTPSDPRLTQN